MSNSRYKVAVPEKGLLVFNQTFAQNEEWISGEDVMQTLNISRSTLYRYRKDGRIPFSRIGRHIVYPKNLVNKYLLQSSLQALRPEYLT